MKNGEEMNCAQALVHVLEREGIRLIFGHPGEQILAFYDALSKSSIKHVLFRHEQGAAHAADGYGRASGHLGVCVATAGPGALNMVMAVATAFKDSIPLLVITGDVSTSQRGQNGFQDIDLCRIFETITLKSFCPQHSDEAVLDLKKALHMLKNGPSGPVHLNLPKDVLVETLYDSSLLQEEISDKITENTNELEDALKILQAAKKPLLLVGTGILWADAVDETKKLVENQDLPIVSTYPARGIISEDHPLCLGMIGTRGTPAGNYAGRHADVVLGLGCRFSDRTLAGMGNSQVIHVNIDPKVLKGDFNIQMDVKKFLNKIQDIQLENTSGWIIELANYAQKNPAEYDIIPKYSDIPLKPQQAIAEIIKASGDSVIVNDAGTYTTWVTLFKKVLKPHNLIFSGGFGPMGYALPAGIGVSLALQEQKEPESKKNKVKNKISENTGKKESVIAITGDGSFQMTLQELATLQQEKIPMVICIINNQSLGIIRQWQELYHSGPYQVSLENPDFVKLAHSYNIEAISVDSPGKVFETVKSAISKKKAFLINIHVDPSEDIPLPKIFTGEK